MSITETGDTPKVRKRPGPKTGAEQVAAGVLDNTKYRPEMCDKVIAWGKEGRSKTWMCAELDIAPQTMYEWAKMHQQFEAALTRAMTHAQRWWEDQAQENLKNPGFKADLWSRNMASRFRKEWTETKHVTNEDGPNRAAATAEDRSRTLELLDRLGLVAAAGGSGERAPPQGEAEFPVVRDIDRRARGAS
jgi:hypothetical protein